MDISIRKLNEKDLDIARKSIDLFLDDEEHATNNERLALLLLRDNFHYLVAFHNETIVGRLAVYEFELYKDNTREAYLYEIDVLESYQGQGVGTLLIESMKEVCVQRGISAMFVGTDENNIPAQRLYAKTGGILEGNLPHFVYTIT